MDDCQQSGRSFENSRGAKWEKSDTNGRMSSKSGPKRLRELLQQPGIICSLGAHDVFTALIVEQAGFETVFIGGVGTSASMLGLPALNFLTMSEMADAVRRMAARVCIPVIADADTGYGDLHNVQRTVEAFEAAGASGILLEDHRLHRSARIACRTGGDREAGEASAVRQYAYRGGDADSPGKGAGATRLQDRGVPPRIADGLR